MKQNITGVPFAGNETEYGRIYKQVRRADPAYREAENAKVREKYANDPEYAARERERKKLQQRRRRAKLKEPGNG